MTKKERQRISRLFLRIESAKQGENGRESAVYSSMDWDRYLAQHVAEERRHRRAAPDNVRHGMPVQIAAEYFAVKMLLQFRTFERKRPDPADIFHLRLSHFMAWAIWKHWQKAIRKAVPMKEAKTFLNELDYAVMVKG